MKTMLLTFSALIVSVSVQAGGLKESLKGDFALQKTIQPSLPCSQNLKIRMDQSGDIVVSMLSENTFKTGKTTTLGASSLMTTDSIQETIKGTDKEIKATATIEGNISNEEILITQTTTIRQSDNNDIMLIQKTDEMGGNTIFQCSFRKITK